MNVVLDGVRFDTETLVAEKRGTLAKVRKDHVWSTYRLSKESGVALTTILDIERGVVSKPRFETIEKLSRALGVDPREIEWPGDPFED